jgi:hypothetical protein
MALTNASTPVSTPTGESLAVTPSSGSLVGIDAANNTVEISQTGSENKIQISQTATQNGVDVVKVGGVAVTGGSVPVSLDSPGTEKKDTGSAAAVAANLGTATINFIDITTATTGHLLKLFGFAQFNVQIKVKGTDNAEFLFTGNDSGGGPINLDLPYGFITQAGGSSKRWEVSITNLDKNRAVDVDLTALWTEV